MNESQVKKPNVWLDLLMGFGISAAAYAVVWIISSISVPMTVNVLVYFVTLGVFVFFIIKFFRMKHTAAAIIMLILISPVTFALILLGACALTLPFS